MVHISSARVSIPGLRPSAAMGWGLGVSLGLHLLVFWPTPARVTQQMPVASTIKAELHLPVQGAALGHDSAGPLPAAADPFPAHVPLDTAVVPAVPRPSAAKPGRARAAALSAPKSPPSIQPAIAPSRQLAPESPLPVPVGGDALTRYRLGLAWHLGRDALLRAAPAPAQAVTVELVVVLAAGRAMDVQVMDDGGSASLAAQAAERTRQAIRRVPVPPELGETPLRVELAL